MIKENTDMSRSWVVGRLREFNNKVAISVDGQNFTYQDIVTSIEHWDARLAEENMQACVVVVNGDYCQAMVGALLSLYQRACIVVPLHLADAGKVDQVCNLTGADYVIDMRSEIALLRVRRASSYPPLITRIMENREAGLILLSSGSTGVPKAMLLSLDKLLERHKNNQRYAPAVTAAFLLFDHIGGFNTLAHCLFNGGTLVALASRDPEYVCSKIHQCGIELLPSTPTFLNMLLISRAFERHDMSSLRLITYGTEVMPQSTLKALVDIFPSVSLKQTYGMSELGILATKSKANDSLWMKLDKRHIDYKVIDDILWIKSHTAMLGYLNAEAMIDADGWLCTGDLVDVDGDYIKIRGRKESIINVAGLKVFPAEVENNILTIPFVRDVVVWGKRNPVTGYIVAASVLKADDIEASEAKKRIVEHCRQHLEEFKVPKFIEFVDRQLHSERFKKLRR